MCKQIKLFNDKTKSSIICLAKIKDIFSQIISFLWKGDNKRSRDQTVDTTMAKPVNNQEKCMICNKSLCDVETGECRRVATFMKTGLYQLFWSYILLVVELCTENMNSSKKVSYLTNYNSSCMFVDNSRKRNWKYVYDAQWAIFSISN